MLLTDMQQFYGVKNQSHKKNLSNIGAVSLGSVISKSDVVVSCFLTL